MYLLDILTQFFKTFQLRPIQQRWVSVDSDNVNKLELRICNESLIKGFELWFRKELQCVRFKRARGAVFPKFRKSYGFPGI